MKQYLAWAFVCLLPVSACFAVETDITVLGLYNNGISSQEDIDNVKTRLANIKDAWEDTGLHTTTGINIKIANNGNPIQIPSLASGDVKSQHEIALNHPEFPGLRNQYAADVVLVFIKASSGNCGHGYAAVWHHNDYFQPVHGLDLRGMDSQHSAGIRLSDTCLFTETHEFGHFLGAGHHDFDGTGLYQTSRGYAWHYGGSHPDAQRATDFRTAVTSRSDCDFFPDPCTVLNVFSKNGEEYGNSTHNNFHALEVTASSVAHYRVPTPSSSVPPSEPLNILGFLIAVCSPDPYDQHFLSWFQGGGGSPDYYEIWYLQEPYFVYRYGWTTTELSTIAFVLGAPAIVRVKACNSYGCSNLSLSSYFADWLCGYLY